MPTDRPYFFLLSCLQTKKLTWFRPMIEKWKTAVENGCIFAALLTSQAFDCIPHDLIIAKLAGYGFDTDALKLIQNHLSNRKKRVKVNRAYIIRQDIFYWCSTSFHTWTLAFKYTLVKPKLQKQAYLFF